MKTETTIYAPHLTRKLGLGDRVEQIAKPIARAIDAATSILPKPLRTDLKNCGGCGRRRETLNSLAGPGTNVNDER